MNATVDTIQAETAGLQSKFTALKGSVDTLITTVKTNNDAQNARIQTLSDQIAALQSAGVDPALLAPLSQLQSDMQAETDATNAMIASLTPPAPPAAG